MNKDIARILAERTVTIVRPAVMNLLRSDYCDGSDFFVIMGLMTNNGGHRLTIDSFGDEENWEYPFDDIARDKFDLSARTGMDTRTVFNNFSHLLKPFDPKYWGSVVDRGLIVAGSGVQEWMDETICRLYSVTFHGLYETFTRRHLDVGDGYRLEVMETPGR